jgi:hypothetical protein
LARLVALLFNSSLLFGGVIPMVPTSQNKGLGGAVLSFRPQQHPQVVLLVLQSFFFCFEGQSSKIMFVCASAFEFLKKLADS